MPHRSLQARSSQSTIIRWRHAVAAAISWSGTHGAEGSREHGDNGGRNRKTGRSLGVCRCPILPNKAAELTAYSLRYAAAFSSSSPQALGVINS